MVLSPQQAILRAIPIPLAVTILAEFVAILSNITSTNPVVAQLMVSIVGFLVFLEKYLQTQESSGKSPIVAPSGSGSTESSGSTSGTSGSKPSPSSDAFVIDSNNTDPKQGSTFTIAVDHGKPNDTVEIIEDDNGTQIMAPIVLDNTGTGSRIIENMSTLIPLGFMIINFGGVTIHAHSVATGQDTESITLGNPQN